MTSSASVRLSQSESEIDLWCGSVPSVQGSGFVPVQEVRLSTRCSDGAGRTWSSMNNYLVSAQETFDTATTPAMGDAYYGINPEGPFISMVCEDGPGHDFSLPEDGKLRYQLSLFDGGTEVWSCLIERVSQKPVQARQAARVVLLDQGRSGTEHGARLLKSLGFVVRRHVVSGESVDLDFILDDLNEALESGDPTYLVGSGRASEAALELAQHCPGLKAVILFSGSGLRFSPWTIKGRSQPAVDCDHSQLRPGPVVCTRKVYAAAVASKTNRERGRIEVEKVEAPLYLFSGLDDQIWPSSAFSELAAQRRKQVGCSYSTIHRTFEGVGHDIGPEWGLPTLPTTERTISHPSTGTRLTLGGKMGRQSRARRECWDLLLQILHGRKIS